MGSCNQFQMSRLHRGDIPLKLLETPMNVVKYYIEVVLRTPKVTSFWPKSAKITGKVIKIQKPMVEISLFGVVLPPNNSFFIPGPAVENTFFAIPKNLFFGRFLAASTLKVDFWPF